MSELGAGSGHGDSSASEVGATPHRTEATFDDLVAPWRSEVLAHCYRMLGSLHDAEDATQETMLRGWRSFGTFEGRSSSRTWLIRIATNVCIDSATRSGARALPMDLSPAAARAVPDGRPRSDIAWLQPYPDRLLVDLQPTPSARYELKESVELAFVAALQRLPPNQRAALLLFDVLGLPAAEVARIMATSTASVNSALQRARSLVTTEMPDPNQQHNLRALGDPALSRVVNAFIDAVERGDTEALVALLAQDATWSMPPLIHWYRGQVSIRDFLNRMALRADWRRVPTHANGQVAVAGYLWDPAAGVYAAYVIDVLGLRGSLIADVTSFIDAAIFPAFGLPLELSSDQGPDTSSIPAAASWPDCWR